MRVSISVESPDQPGVIRLLDAGDALSASLYPAESNHMLPLDALLDPAVTFLVARSGGAVVGCGSLVRKAGYAEIKRMFVDEEARGQGIARRILGRIVEIARAEGFPAVRLETGIHQPAAIALYRGAGFVEMPPFGEYEADAFSIFMELPLR